MATKQNFALTLGETWVIPLPCVDPDGGPLDLVRVANVMVRIKGPGALLEFDLESGVSVLDPATGSAQVVVASSDQLGLRAQVHRYECRVLMADGELLAQSYGVLNIRPSLFGASATPLVVPTQIFLKPAIVVAGGPAGALIGALSTEVAAVGERWSLIDNAGDRIALRGRVLEVGASPPDRSDVGRVLKPELRVVNRTGAALVKPVPIFVLPAGALRGDASSQAGLMNVLGIF